MRRFIPIIIIICLSFVISDMINGGRERPAVENFK